MYSNSPGHMTEMGASLIYSQNPFKSFPEPEGQSLGTTLGV